MWEREGGPPFPYFNESVDIVSGILSHRRASLINIRLCKDPRDHWKSGTSNSIYERQVSSESSYTLTRCRSAEDNYILIFHIKLIVAISDCFAYFKD